MEILTSIVRQKEQNVNTYLGNDTTVATLPDRNRRKATAVWFSR
jgi:hypothetical protein